MKRRLVGLLTALALAAAVPMASAQSRATLSRIGAEIAASLDGEALAHFELAAELYDRVNFDEMVIELDKAARLAPENVTLQFVTAVAARNRADVYYGAASFGVPPDNMDYSSPPWRTSEPFFDIAESALQRLMVNSNLTVEERARLDTESNLVQTRRAAIVERDQERIKTALPMVLSIQQSRREAMKTGLFAEVDPLDPAAPYFARERSRRDREREERQALAAAEQGLAINDPFAPLPGEYTRPAIPPPPPPQQFQPQQGFGEAGRDPFAGAEGGAPMMDPTVIGAGEK